MSSSKITESLLINSTPTTVTTQAMNSDVNENNAKKGAQVVTLSSGMTDGAVPLVAGAAMVTSMPFSQVSTPPSVMGFPSGMNLTISNGIINVKNPNGGESTLLVAPTTSLATSSLSSNASTPIPISMVKGTLPAISTPVSSVAMTTPASLLGNTQVTHSHTQLKVPNPTNIQLRPPQVYGTLSNNIAMAMQNRLSLPFQTTVPQNLTIPTSLNTLRTLATVSAPAPQVQFQMAPMRGTAVTIGSGSHITQQQPTQQQQMSIRPATFPVLINRPITLTAARPQLIAQPSRLAPRQVALQVAGQQPGAGTLMPLFRPTQATKAVSVAAVSAASNTGISTQTQALQPQFVNQVMATTNMPGMTHISFRPNTPSNKILERPQKIPDARLQTGVPVARFIRPPVVAASSVLNSDSLLTVPQNGADNSVVGSVLQPKTENKSQEKKMFDTSMSSQSDAHTKKIISLQTSTASQGIVVSSMQGSTPQFISKSPVKDATPKSIGKEGSSEGKKEEGADPGTSSTSEFDALGAMDWSDGIASLPGSNLKLQVNEFGLMEVVTEEPAQVVKTVVDSAVGVNTTNFPITSTGPSEVVSETQPGMSKKDKELKKCENCGKYGFPPDFCKTGRFCSQACVGAFAGRKNKHVAGQSLLNPKVLMKVKKKQKKMRLEESLVKIVPPSNESELGTEKEKISTSSSNKGTTSSSSRKSKGFDWPAYLEEQKAIGAPARIFRDPFPSQKNGFKAAMRLEGVDPKHQNLFCVLSVAEVQGYRIRLHFDGYSECYDFWCNADSPFIFPVGWCERNNKQIQPPKQVTQQSFNWAAYLRTTKSIAAPKNLFQNQPTTMVTPSAFRVGMKLEAVDRKNNVLICVATVADILGDKVLVHFDGWDDIYDYWCDITSPYIHPVGWCQENGRALSPPYDWENIDSFTWEAYLTQTKSQAVPARAFKPRPPAGFEVGMKLEVIDRRNPILIRVATIQEVADHQVLVHFDGWPEMYDYWVDDDSPEIKPPGWSSRTGGSLEPPYVEDMHQQGNCPTPGCNGLGHIKGAKYVGHHSAFGCPYSSLNMNKESTLQDRLGSTRVEEGAATPQAGRIKLESGEVRKCPTPGCDSSGHITGKFTSHHRQSGCPLYEKNFINISKELAEKSVVRPGRGRKRKYFSTSEVDVKEESGQPAKKDRYEFAAKLKENIHQSVFMSGMPVIPMPEDPAFWDYHARLLTGVGGDLKLEEVKKWNVDQVANFVSSVTGCKDHERNFRVQQMDGEAFLMLSQADLVDIMKLKLGPAIKVYNSVLLLTKDSDFF